MKFLGRMLMALAASVAMFSACTFDLDPVKDPGYVKVRVIVKTTFGDDVTSQSNVKVTSDNLGDNSLTYISEGGCYYAYILANVNGNKTVNSQTLTFTATYGQYTETETLTIPGVLPGNAYFDEVLIILGPEDPEYYLKLESTTPVTYSYGYLDKATFKYTDPETQREVLLMENATEYYLSRNEDVLVVYGHDVVDFGSLTPAKVKEFATPFIGIITEETIPYHIVVSAWSLYGLEREYGYYYEKYGVYKKGLEERIGGFDVLYKNTNIRYLEYPHPSHRAHYIHGHGHEAPHGYSGNTDNAGGGIIQPL